MPRYSFIKLGSMALASGFLAMTLSSCQSLSSADFSEDPMALAPPVAQGLDADGLSTLMIAELAGLRGDYARATEGYIQAAERYQSAALAERAALAARFLNDPAALEETTRRWLQLAPDADAPLRLLASLAIQRRDWPLALEQRLAIISRGGDAQLLELVETALESGANTRPLLDQLHEHLASGGRSTTDIQLATALLEAASGLKISAQQRLERLPDAAADAPDVWRLRAATALDMDSPRRARDSARKGLKLQPDDPQLMLLLAQAEIRLGRLDSAEATTDALLENHGGTSGMRLALARLYVQEGQPGAAQRLLLPLLGSTPTPAPALLMLGGIAQLEGEVDNALLYYRRVPEGDSFVLSRSSAAQTLAEDDRLADARRFLENERRAHPDFADQLIAVEVALLDRFEQHEQANELLDDYLERSSDSAELRYQRAMRAYRLGDLAGMEAELRHVLEKNPDDAIALNALGYTLADEEVPGRLDEAAAMVERAHELDPDNPAILDSLGWVLFRQGDPEAALPWLERAWERMPDQEIASHLIEVLWALDQRLRARQLLERALQRFEQRPAIDDLLRRIPALAPTGSRD
ncbi:MAG TPA: tetratricopeptide repeat protein [Halomonas sp.]|nr:tetratricopeptide repeat protein [Halomonas sp.]